MLALLLVACTSIKPESGSPEDTGPFDRDGDGFSSIAGDCDDGDASIYPGAVEIPDDGIDQDCMGGDVRTDADNDGFNADQDCDDTDASIYPGAPEICDGIDQNCSGVADEGLELLAYEDADGDGFGSDASIVGYCEEIPEGYVGVGGDCAKDDPNIYPGATELCNLLDDDCDGTVDEEAIPVEWYQDGDGDGYGNPDSAVLTCTPEAGFILTGGDCDDWEAGINPEASELCDDIDRNCDGDSTANATDASSLYEDLDGDGFGNDSVIFSSCEAPGTGESSVGGDCDDRQASVYPDAEEVCDSLDNDCDGGVDIGAVDPKLWYADSDGDGYGDGSISLEACDAPVGYVESGDDCDDNDSTINPGAFEICDGVDNDCDGLLDEQDDSNIEDVRWYEDSDGDGYGEDATVILSCSPIAGRVSEGGDCDESDASVNPGATEICDGIDNNCDGNTDGADATGATSWYQDGDNDSFGNPAVEVVQCNVPTGYVPNNEDCDDTNAAINPDAAELCSGVGVDENCDGLIDDASAADIESWYEDVDGDSYGNDNTEVVTCSPPADYVNIGGDCDDSNLLISPRASELCDGLDNNCDGEIDESGAVGELSWYEDGDGDGHGNPDSSMQACDQPAGYSDLDDDCDDADSSSYSGAVEAADETDNDCDGWIDEDFIQTGDLVIQEIARQTAFGTGSVVAEGQWFEIINVSSMNIYLDNFTIVRNGGNSGTDQFSVDPAMGLVLVPGQLAVFCNTNDYEYPGDPSSDLQCDYYWSDETQNATASGTYYDNTFNLQVDEDTLGIYIEGDASNGQLLDEVAWYYDANNGLWPQLQGYSMLLDPDHVDATDNDFISYWCVSPNTPASSYAWYTNGIINEYGTPGSSVTKECYPLD